jgi:lactate dehydrogenase-like 2-hydroxyacid dehydrogenase
MKVFISRIIPEIATRLIKEAGHTVTQFTERRDLLFEELVSICKDHDAFLSVSHNKLNKEFLNQCTNLKVISLFSVGYDHLDVQEATRLKIPVGNTPNVLSDATADTAFLLMLAVSRKAIYLHKTIAKAEWGYYDPVANLGIELNGKTLGIFGLGENWL